MRACPSGSENENAPSAMDGAARGFTLAEVLIAIAIVLLLTLIAIPNLPGTRIESNENSAIASLRAIYQAEVKYEANYPSHGFACSLAELGGNPKAAAPSPAEAQVLQNDLADGEKSGYLFRVSNCREIAANAREQSTSFDVTALPKQLGKTGHRGFCIDQQGEVKADPAGGSNCTQSLQ